MSSLNSHGNKNTTGDLSVENSKERDDKENYGYSGFAKKNHIGDYTTEANRAHN